MIERGGAFVIPDGVAKHWLGKGTAHSRAPVSFPNVRVAAGADRGIDVAGDGGASLLRRFVRRCGGAEAREVDHARQHGNQDESRNPPPHLTILDLSSADRQEN